MKILLVFTPLHGHNVPAAGFIAELTKRGHAADVIISSLLVPEIKNLMDATGANIIDCEAKNSEDYTNETAFGFFMASMIEKAYKLAASNDYDVIVYDSFNFPVYYFSELTGTPVVRFFPSLVFQKAFTDMFKETAECKQSSFAINLGKGIIKSLEEKGFNFKFGNFGDELAFQIPPLNIVRFLKEMQPCVEEFDDRFAYVGPSIKACEVTDNPCKKMDGKIIYVSFGTLVSFAEEDQGKRLFDKIIKAYENENVNVIMDIGSLFPEDLSYIPDNFYVFHSMSLPQVAILPYVDLFIMHGGANSTNEAIYYGVPMIVLPPGRGVDHFYIAEQVADKGIGAKLDRRDFTINQLKKMSFDILSSEEIKNNIKKMQAKMRSINSDELAVDLLEDFVKKQKDESTLKK